jgi:ABC-type transport system involved in cytochrome c biogenesis ATPase subunit
MASTRPKSAYEMIIDWSPSRPVWQQDALRRIVAKGKLSDHDIADLVQLCLKGQGKPGIALEATPLTGPERFTRTTAGGTITLRSISEVENANRLAANQLLSFAPTGLTVIYGDNGVGKSGYARILKRACRARFTAPVLPNAFEPAAGEKATARIGWADEGIECPPVEWSDDGHPHFCLSAVSVFDRESAAVHVREENEVAFRPFGLDVPDELAAVCQSIKDKLTAEQTRLGAARDALFTSPTFSPTTAVGRIMSALRPDTDLAPLRVLEPMSDAELGRLTRLTEDLAGDPLKAAGMERAWATSLDRFAADLDIALANCSLDRLDALLASADDARTKRAAARLAANEAFSTAVVPGVGEQPWRILWEAARKYSDTLAYPDQVFPGGGEDASCVLCHQQLDASARRRLQAFEDFIRSDTENQAREAEKVFAEKLRAIDDAPIKISAFPFRVQLSLRDRACGKAVLKCLSAARLRRAMCLRALKDELKPSWPAVPANPGGALRDLAVAARLYADELAEAADIVGRTRLEAERDALRDRSALGDLLSKAQVEIERLADLRRLGLCLAETNTTEVTKLGNAIADHVITPKVRDRFQEEIQKLAASRVRVDIVRSGGKFGSPQYQVRLFANEKAKVHSVLSEGEQTCVALAVFLTELATASFASTLVFDDPVSSLDHRWRQKVAERLVEEAQIRQIIVFTHDLVFLNDLQTLATRAGIVHKEIGLIQTSLGAGVVQDGLPWIGQRVPERLDNLEKEARAARALYEANDDQGYGAAVATFYNRLRSTWERALEDVAFCNVIHRHRDYIDTKDLKKVAALETGDITAWKNGFKICCDITDAHDPSRGRNAALPPPEDLLKHVQELSEWARALRERHKLIN